MITLNNTQIKSIFFNGVKLKNVLFNGLKVFTSQLDYIFRNGSWLVEHNNGVFSASGSNLHASINVNGQTGSSHPASLYFDLDCTDVEQVILSYSCAVSGSYDSFTQLKHTFRSGNISKVIQYQMESGDDPVTGSGTSTLNVAVLTGVQRFYLDSELTCRQNTDQYNYTGHADSTITGIDVVYSS